MNIKADRLSGRHDLCALPDIDPDLLTGKPAKQPYLALQTAAVLCGHRKRSCHTEPDMPVCLLRMIYAYPGSLRICLTDTHLRKRDSKINILHSVLKQCNLIRYPAPQLKISVHCRKRHHCDQDSQQTQAVHQPLSPCHRISAALAVSSIPHPITPSSHSS